MKFLTKKETIEAIEYVEVHLRTSSGFRILSLPIPVKDQTACKIVSIPGVGDGSTVTIELPLSNLDIELDGQGAAPALHRTLEERLIDFYGKPVDQIGRLPFQKEVNWGKPPVRAEKAGPAKVYTFHIAYEGLEDRIWRKVEVSSKYRLDKLGYMVLAIFDTLAYHLFEFYYNGERFGLPAEDSPVRKYDMADFKLEQLDLQIGSRLRMDYDFGTTQTFWLELVGIEEMGRGRGNHYPYLIDGAGCGIIDDMSCGELEELVAQVDRNGQIDEPIEYNGATIFWDYRHFDLKPMNHLLKGEIEAIEEGYAPFWGGYY